MLVLVSTSAWRLSPSHQDLAEPRYIQCSIMQTVKAHSCTWFNFQCACTSAFGGRQHHCLHDLKPPGLFVKSGHFERVKKERQIRNDKCLRDITPTGRVCREPKQELCNSAANCKGSCTELTFTLKSLHLNWGICSVKAIYAIFIEFIHIPVISPLPSDGQCGQQE